MNEQKQVNERNMVVNDVKHVTSSVQLKNGDRTITVTVPATGALAITLPPVAGANGQRIFIHTIERAENYSNGSVTIADKGDAILALSITGITAADKYVVLESNGLAWYNIAAN